MKHCYKDALDKITVDERFEQQLKARLGREQARIDATREQRQRRKSFNILIAASTAAVVLLTVVLTHFSLSGIAQHEQNTVYETDYSSQQSYAGYTAISTVTDMSYRIVSPENKLDYRSSINFIFEGFDKYGIEISKSCILFESALDPSYTLANFFFDYYNIITQQSGYTLIDNGVLESFFGIKDNSVQTISVYDEFRGEIVDLDSVLMSEYWEYDEINFTVKVSSNA